MGNTSSTNDAIDKALNPDRNGLTQSVKKTNQDFANSVSKTGEDMEKTNLAFAKSVADTQKKIDEQNKYIGDKLQSNFAALSSGFGPNPDIIPNPGSQS